MRLGLALGLGLGLGIASVARGGVAEATGAVGSFASAAGLAAPAAAVESQPSAGRCCRLRLNPEAILARPLDFASWRLVSWERRPAGMRLILRQSAPSADEIVAAARHYLGTPYTWGGNSPGGLDCSGFVNKVYADNGYDLPRGATDQFAVGDPVAFDALAPGDLIFFNPSPGAPRISHVGLYVGNGEMIHASSGKGEVTYDRLGMVYYRTRFAGARRLLTLPPGLYSSDDGGAPPSGSEETSLDGLVRAALADDDSRSAGTAATSAIEERPRQLASFHPQSGPPRGGPMTLRSDNTAVGARLGAGRLADRARLLAVVEASYFGEDSALALRLAAPFEVPGAGEGRDAAGHSLNGWDTPRDYSKVVQEIRYGQPGSDLYVDLGRTASGTLGNGLLMRNFTPNLASRMLPDYTLEPNDLSLDFNADFGAVAVQSFVDDVVAPRVLGVAGYVHSAALASAPSFLPATTRLGFAYAVDSNAPYDTSAGASPTRPAAVHALAVEAEVTPVHEPSVSLATYLSGGTLMHQGRAGVGGAGGVVLQGGLGESFLHALRLRVEVSLAGAGFIPSYFDGPYRLDRQLVPRYDAASPAITKLRLLDTFAGSTARWGTYVDAGYQVQRRFGVGVAYQDEGTWRVAAARYAGRSLFVYLDVRDLYFPASSKSMSMYLAYYRRGFVALGPWLSGGRASQYAFAALSLQLSRYLALGGAARRAIDGAGGSDVFDAVVDLTLRYEL